MTRETPDLSASRALNRELVSALWQHLSKVAYPMRTAAVGQSLVNTGDKLTHLPVIEEGRIEAVVHVGAQGNFVIPITFDAGEMALTSALFSTMPIDVDLVVSSGLAARWVPIRDVEQCLLQSTELMVLTLRFLAQRLREVQARERGLMERGIHERVCAVLARVSAETPVQADGRLLIATTHEHLAARCAVSRPKLSHELKDLERAGLIRLGRGTIEILDPQGFADGRRGAFAASSG